MTRLPSSSQFERRHPSVLRRSPIATLDVGSSKVACMIAENSEDTNHNMTMRVTGFGHQLSTGLNAGQVVDMRTAEDSIRAAVDAAERMAGLEVRQLIIGVSANRLASQICVADVALHGHPVNDAHIVTGLRHAYEKFQTGENEILHAIPLSYGIDDSLGISDPHGMFGETLRVNMHLISAPVGPIQNLLACIERCHLKCEKLVVTPYASALSTLMRDEIDLGVTHIDMGGGTSSVSIFYRGAPVFNSVIPVGGHHITTDIAHGLNVFLSVAERIKILYGSALIGENGTHDQFEVSVPGGGHQMLPRSELTKIIRPRLEETFELIHNRVTKSGLAHLGGTCVVLTGGGAQLSGASQVAQAIFKKQTRTGMPMRIAGLPEAASGPGFAACTGLLTYAGQNHADAALEEARRGGPLVWVTGWLRRNF